MMVGITCGVKMEEVSWCLKKTSTIRGSLNKYSISFRAYTTGAIVPPRHYNEVIIFIHSKRFSDVNVESELTTSKCLSVWNL